MKQLLAFTKKEFMESGRNGRILILGMLFLAFGIMNPAIAKLTPWLMEMVSDQMAETGMILTPVEVDAMASWTQYYKNMPMAVIIVVLMFGGAFATEYQKGTLVNVVTKGMVRWKIVISKLAVMLLLWTMGYFLCYGVTYVYTGYYWDNGTVSNLFPAAVLFWLGGIWILTVVALASTITGTTAMVLMFTFVAYLVSYLLSMIPKLAQFMPTHVMSVMELLTGQSESADFVWTVCVVVILCVLNIAASIFFFNRKQL